MWRGVSNNRFFAIQKRITGLFQQVFFTLSPALSSSSLGPTPGQMHEGQDLSSIMLDEGF